MCSVIAARFATHTSVASSSHTTYVTLRGSPVDGAIVARFTQSGAYFGSCFSQIPREHLDPVRISLQSQRIIAQIRQDHRRNRPIIRHQIALRITISRKQNLILMVQFNGLPTDIDHRSADLRATAPTRSCQGHGVTLRGGGGVSKRAEPGEGERRRRTE